jgi:hypothetical protein
MHGIGTKKKSDTYYSENCLLGVASPLFIIFVTIADVNSETSNSTE